MQTLLRDLRYGLRVMLKKPTPTAIAVLVLALGIGANSAIFSVVNAVLLRPLPFDDAEQIAMLWGYRGDPTEQRPSSYADVTDWKAQAGSLEQVAAYSPSIALLLGQGEPESLLGTIASADLFPLLRVRPALGRTYTREEDAPGAPRVLVLSHALWQRRFGSDPNVVGRELNIDGKAATVIGVMPAGFKFPLDEEKTEYWMPVASDPNVKTTSRALRNLVAVARLKPGVSLAQAQAEMDTIVGRQQQQYPATNAGRGLHLTPLHESLTGDMRLALLMLLGAVVCVLFIACADVANLLLTRASERENETALRLALGAGMARIVRQLLTESLMLSVIGGALGFLLALWGTQLLIAAGPKNLPRLGVTDLDWRVLVFTAVVTLLTGLIFGLAPALRAARTDLTASLREGGRGATEGVRRNRMRSLLVASEVALSLVLLIGAGLLIKSFMRLHDVDSGFDPRNVIKIGLAPNMSKYPDGEQQKRLFEQVTQKIAATPGVESVGAVDFLPLGGGGRRVTFTVQGHAPPEPGQEPFASYRSITPDYFRAMGIRLHKGRAFSERDEKDAPYVVIVNEAAARRFLLGEDPLGKRLVVDAEPDNPNPPAREIVGIVGNVRHEGLDVEGSPEIYKPYGQPPMRYRSMEVVVRAASADVRSLTPVLRGAIREVDKDQVIPDLKTMDEVISESVARRKFVMLLLGVFAVIALLLAVFGIYGVMTYSVTLRTHEIGIRMALGASAGRVLNLIIFQGMRPVLGGLVVGLLGAFALTRIISSLLFGVSATDPLIFFGLSLLLALVALLACYIPARRAMRVEPTVALRHT